MTKHAEFDRALKKYLEAMDEAMFRAVAEGVIPQDTVHFIALITAAITSIGGPIVVMLKQKGMSFEEANEDRRKLLDKLLAELDKWLIEHNFTYRSNSENN